MLSPSGVSADDLAMRGYALWYRGVTRENVLAARALLDRALVLNNSWNDDRPAEMRRHERAVVNLERLDRDGIYTYSAKSFQLFLKRDFPAMLRNTTEWSGRFRLPLELGAQGLALLLNGRFDEAVQVLESALRLGPHAPPPGLRGASSAIQGSQRPGLR